MSLWLARHAPVPGPAGLCYGSSDLPADPALTTASAQRLAAALPHGTRVWCSPLARCRVLAAALQALRADLAPTLDPRLAEMDFGDWEGRPWDAIGPAAITAWTDDFLQHRPGGGESVAQFLERVRHALADCRAAAPRDTLWITHAGVIKAARVLQPGARPLAQASDWPRDTLACGQWTVLQPIGGSAAAVPASPAAARPGPAPAPPGARPPT